MPPRDADVVSPELALVDPALAERARGALTVEPVPSPRVAPEPTPTSIRPRHDDRRRMATPALTLLATAAASLVVTAFTDSERASGEPPVSASPSSADHRTLAWPRVSDVASYDVELVRGSTVVFSSRSTSTRLAVPGSWERDGVRYAIQPEDQVFVWPVVEGKRAAPVVDGVLVLDATLVARLIAGARASP